MGQNDLNTFVTPLASKIAAEMGYELIDAELVKEGPGLYLRIYLDKHGGITLDDCERFHRAIQPKLERVGYDFLEISSPGMDRPIKTDQDFEKAIGKDVEVRLYKPVEGKKTYQGALLEFSKDALWIQTAEGKRMFTRREAALIKPIIVFEEDEGDGEP